MKDLGIMLVLGIGLVVILSGQILIVALSGSRASIWTAIVVGCLVGWFTPNLWKIVKRDLEIK